MNPLAISFAVAGLALVAGAGVMAGFLREAPPPVEPLADPLEDRREALLRSLADLEEAHSSGALDEAGYLRLREQSEGRMARVLRALDRRDAAGSETVVALGDAPTGDVRTGAEPGRIPPWAVAVLIGATVVAVVVASLARDAEPRPQASTAQASDDPLGFFERRVQEHPDDLAARLDLAHRYLDAGMVEDALSEYAVALELDPDDAEALAHIGIILYQNGRPEEALRSVDRALSTDPRYPEGLFIRGVILLRGLDRPQDAISAFETYLEAAPFGVERQTAKDLIAEARAATDQT
ncbi:MAG TPA: tetratricopeptide repeat protein [Actinomycetota bacterium]|nr:tetratricopeptide repeat protein [Actinomycetota bacterium]